MICEICKKNTATTHIKTSVNGNVTEKHLCSECAAKEGLGAGLHYGSPFSDMLTSIFGDTASLAENRTAKRCKCCNSSLNDIVNSGKLGCSECYETFFDELLPYFKRIHGSVKHIGKAPALNLFEAHTETENESSDKETARALKAKLKELIETENFEEAAVIRDRIKALEEEEK